MICITTRDPKLSFTRPKVQIGELEALVVPDLSDNLVSFADFTDKGSTILLDSAGGVISNSLNDKQIVLKKDIGTWRLSLSDIANYDHKQDSYMVYSASVSKTKLARYITLHERSCHQPAEVLIRVLEGDCPCWIRADITPQEIREVASSYTCPVCVLSKRRAKSVAANLDDPDGFYGGINSKNAKPGQIISIDPVGPISPKSINGFSLMWLVYDIGSSNQWVFFSETKRSSIVMEIVRQIIADLKFYDKKLKILLSDAEEIFNSSDVQLFLSDQGIKHQYSVPYEHYQNRVERLIQHNVRGISSLIGGLRVQKEAKIRSRKKVIRSVS